MSENIRSVQTEFFSWATTTERLNTPCEQWPQSALGPADKKKRKSKEELRYELARRYHAANKAAARLILADPARYAGVMQEWAQTITHPRRWSNAA